MDNTLPFGDPFAAVAEFVRSFQSNDWHKPDIPPPGTMVSTISAPGSQPILRLRADIAYTHRHIYGYVGSMHKPKHSGDTGEP